MILFLFLQSNDYSDLERQYFHFIKEIIYKKLKYDYYDRMEENDLNEIFKKRNLQELKKYISYLEKKYHKFVGDYIYLGEDKVFKYEPRQRTDSGISSTGKYIPGSPSLSYCYYFNKKNLSHLPVQTYHEKDNDVCFYNNNIFISSYTINDDFLSILVNISLSNVEYDTLVIDFIDNQGGNLSIALVSLYLLSGNGVITYDVYKRDTIYTINNIILTTLPSIKYKVLIFILNKNTASASELITFYMYNSHKEKIILINEDNRTVGKRTILEFIYIKEILKSISTNSILNNINNNILYYFKQYRKYFYPFNFDAIEKYQNLIFVYVVGLLIYDSPFNKEEQEKIKEKVKSATARERIINILLFTP